MATLADFRLRDAVRRKSAGRMLASAETGVHNAASDLPAHDAIFRMISYVENFAASILRARVGLDLPSTSGLLEAARAELQRIINQSWHNRKTKSKTWLTVDFTTSADFVIVEGFVEARNSIAHGLGELTAQQLSQSRIKDTHKRLRAASIAWSGVHLDLRDRDVFRCARSSRGFTLWLDEQINPLLEL